VFSIAVKFTVIFIVNHRVILVVSDIVRIGCYLCCCTSPALNTFLCFLTVVYALLYVVHCREIILYF